MSLTKVTAKIQEQRKKQDITTVEFLRVMSHKLNLSTGTIYRIIKKPWRAKYQHLQAVVEYVGLTMDDILDEIHETQEQAME